VSEFQPSSDRDRIVADAEQYRRRQTEELHQEFSAWEADEEKAQTEAAAEPSADGDPDDGPSDDLSDARDGAGPTDQLAWILAADDDQEFVRRVFQDLVARLDELGCRIAVFVEDGHLDADRRRALFDRILDSNEFLMAVASALEPDPRWYAH
jgi:hypothetical protein